jgi:predicted nucleic acid-binding protein
MIVLDTNVLSEVLRPRPTAAVQRWFGRQSAPALFTTAICEAEMLLGAALLASGRRRHAIEEGIAAMFQEQFSGRVLSFDRAAAREFAHIAASRREAGRPIAELDAQIAAIARAHGAALATRNVADFRDCGTELVDPWAVS